MIEVSLPDGAAIGRPSTPLIALMRWSGTSPVCDQLSVSLASVCSKVPSLKQRACHYYPRELGDRPEEGGTLRCSKINGALQGINEATCFAFLMPPIPGLGTAAGVEFILQDRQSRSEQELAQTMRGFVQQAMAHPAIAGAMSTFRAEVPQIEGGY